MRDNNTFTLYVTPKAKARLEQEDGPGTMVTFHMSAECHHLHSHSQPWVKIIQAELWRNEKRVQGDRRWRYTVTMNDRIVGCLCHKCLTDFHPIDWNSPFIEAKLRRLAHHMGFDIVPKPHKLPSLDQFKVTHEQA